MQNKRELEYYATPGPMTDLTHCPADVFEGLPDAPAELVTMARRCVIAVLPNQEDRSDPQVRPAAAMIERIQELDPSPLVDRPWQLPTLRDTDLRAIPPQKNPCARSRWLCRLFRAEHVGRPLDHRVLAPVRGTLGPSGSAVG